MKIVKSIEMKYTIIYIEDDGKYSVYKRFDSNEWFDISKNKLVSNKEYLKILEKTYSDIDNN
jgi:hypothetical protein